MIDKKSVIIGTFAGMLIGIITSVFLAWIIITAIGESFQVENVNISIHLNESAIIEAINESRPSEISITKTEKVDNQWYVSEHNIELSKEYDKGYLTCLEQTQSHILFAGSTFEYDNKYVIKVQYILPNKVELRVLQNGSDVFNGTCYENNWCNIKDVSFQIDDVHIGKEAAYFVYWSDK